MSENLPAPGTSAKKPLLPRFLMFLKTMRRDDSAELAVKSNVHVEWAGLAFLLFFVASIVLLFLRNLKR